MNKLDGEIDQKDNHHSKYLYKGEEKEISSPDYMSILRPKLFGIILVSLICGVALFLYMFTQPNVYRASAIITPSIDETQKNPAFGALASIGVVASGPTKAEDLESVFLSKDLTVRVFFKYNIWPTVLPTTFNVKSGTIRRSWIDYTFGRLKIATKPSDWDAIHVAERNLVVSVNQKNGTVSISYDSPSPEGSAQIVKYYLEEAKNLLQEEALERATKNEKFIQQQIARTVDALTRDRLYTLYGQEVEREMVAQNREQFGFRIIDSPRIPDRKVKPRRVLSAVMGAILSFLFFCGYFIVRGTPPGSTGSNGTDTPNNQTSGT